MIGSVEEIKLFDDSEFMSITPVNIKPVLDEAIEYFMMHVELDPTDEGYELDDNGFVLNHYVREYRPEVWSGDAEVFELRAIDRKLDELGESFIFGAKYLLSLFEDKECVEK